MLLHLNNFWWAKLFWYSRLNSNKWTNNQRSNGVQIEFLFNRENKTRYQIIWKSPTWNEWMNKSRKNKHVMFCFVNFYIIYCVHYMHCVYFICIIIEITLNIIISVYVAYAIHSMWRSAFNNTKREKKWLFCRPNDTIQLNDVQFGKRN